MFDDDPTTDRPRPRRALIVDDNAPERSALGRVLTLRGYDVESVGDGAAALAVLEAGPGIDVLLTDLRLPDLDGREVALRAAGLVPRPVVALMTGWDYDLDGRDRAHWGIDLLFMKPLDMHALLDALGAALTDAARA